MKRFSLNLFAMMSFMALALIVTSCNKGTDVVTPSTTNDSYETTAFFANVPFVDDVTATTATETTPFVLLDNTLTGPGDPNTGNGKKVDNPRPGPNPIAKVLRMLNLTDEQKASVKQFITEYQPCHKAAMTALREAQKTIIEAANAERKTIMEDLKTGAIDRKEAGRLLAELNKTTRTTLQNDEDVQAALAAVKACDEELMAKIKGILTEEQKAKLARILGQIRK